VRAVFPDRAIAGGGTGDVDCRAVAVVRALIARGWPWSSGIESGRLPESYRTAAAAVAEQGFGAGISGWLNKANDYRRARRAAGASAVRSLAGGARLAAAGLAAFVQLRREMGRGRQ